MKDKISAITRNLPLPDILKFFTNLTEAYKEHKLTERELAKINAQREVILAEISARHETYRQLFEHVFAERKQVIAGLFDVIDKGVAANDRELILHSVHSLGKIVTTSPFTNTEELSRLLESGKPLEI